MTEKSNPPKVVRKHMMWVPGSTLSNPPISNPVGLTSGRFVERQEYNFIPRPRAIVTAPIKFHNECFVPGSLVISNPGALPIENLEIGDKVLGWGEFTNVTHKFERDYDGNVITIYPMYTLPFSVTPNHPIHTIKVDRKTKGNVGIIKTLRKDGWRNAEDLRKGDYLTIPKYKITKDPPIIDLSNYLPTDNWTVTDDYVYYHKTKKYKRFIKPTNSFFRFLGWYVAEGYKEQHGVGLSLGNKDMNEILSLSKKIDSELGVISNIRDTREYPSHGDDREGMLWRFSNGPLINFLVDVCGDGSKEKRIPDFVLDSPPELLKEFLMGYLGGDGHIDTNYERKSGYKISRIIATTISPKLIFGIQMAFGKLGVLGSITVVDGKFNKEYRFSINNKNHIGEFLGISIEKKTESHSLYLEDSNAFYVPIRKIESYNYSGKVFPFNFSINESQYETIKYSHPRSLGSGKNTGNNAPYNNYQ